MRRFALSAALTLAVIAAGVCFAPLRADAEDFTFELKEAIEDLEKKAEELAEDDPNSLMAKNLIKLFTNIGEQLFQMNAQLQQKETPVQERIPILRRLYLQQMRRIHEMKPDGASTVMYNERRQKLSFYHYDVQPSGEFTGGGGSANLSSKLKELLDIDTNQPNQEDYDLYSDRLFSALGELSVSWRDFFFNNRDHIGYVRYTGPTSRENDTASRFARKLEFPAGARSMVETVVYELTKLDIQLGLQNLTDEERSKKLRERFLEIVQRVGEIWQIVQYDEPTGQILFFDRYIGNPINDAAGNPIAFAYPHSLMSILGLKTIAQPAYAQPPEPPKPPPAPLGFTAQLKDAVFELAETGREIASEDPGSSMAQSLARLLAGIGSELLLKNEQLEAKKTPEEERIPILRQMYLLQMRQIHEMEPDGNSMAQYNEREQTLSFRHYTPSGGGGGGGSFSSKLGSLLKLRAAVDSDPTATDLRDGSYELFEAWWDFYFKHEREVRHIIEREIVPPNRTGMTPPLPTPLEEYTDKNFEHLIEQIRYELTRMDVELAEQNVPREERAKKLRSHFLEMIWQVKHIGLQVQVESGAVKIPFRDAKGPIFDSAGVPIVFEFPPKLMSALNMNGRPKSLQPLLLGGGAALLLLVLAGVFLVKRSGSAKESHNNAETE